METTTASQTDSRIGQFLSINGVVHRTPRCATMGRNKGVEITAEDVAYWTAERVEPKTCKRCL